MINFKRGEDRVKIYLGLFLLGLFALFLVSGVSLSEVSFVLVPFDKDGSVQTDNYKWSFNTAPYAFVVNTEAKKLYGGTYECKNSIVNYVYCWQASEPGAGYKPDSYCPHPGPLLCPYGCEREGLRGGWPIGQSTSISRIKDLMCKNVGLADEYYRVERLGMQIVLESDTEYRVFAPDSGRYPYHDVTSTYKTIVYKTDSIVFGESGTNYAYAKLYDGRCSYSLCFGSACSGLVTSVECSTGEPTTEPDIPEEPTPSEPSQPTEPTDPTTPTEPTEPESPTGPDSPTDPDRPVQPIDEYGCYEDTEIWCAEMNRCIEIGDVCEDGIYDVPGGEPLPGQNPTPIEVPDVDCGIAQHLVCASNGNTYLNDCWLNAYKATKVADGQCGTCGNDYIELGEQCDNTVVRQSCADLGYLDEGYVDCYNDCTLNTGDCRQSVCGDRVVEGKESWLNCCLDTECPSINFVCSDNICTPRDEFRKCLDGSDVQTCSADYPGYFCNSKGQLIEDCVQCGGCDPLSCIEGQTSCDLETYTFSKCFNNKFIEVSSCADGCKDEFQCNAEIEYVKSKDKSKNVITTLSKLITPDYPKETSIITKKGIRPKTTNEILNETITFKNIILTAMLFIILLIGADTYNGKIKWQPIINKAKKRLGIK